MTVTAVAPAEVGVEVGTFFVHSWGYDQTQVDYYKVVGLTPKGVRVQHWSGKDVSTDDNPHDSMVPGDRPRQVRVWPNKDTLDDCEFCRTYLTHNTYVSVAPDCPDHGSRMVDAPVETKRLQSYVSERVPDASGTYIAVGPYGDHASLWDGKPHYQTGWNYQR